MKRHFKFHIRLLPTLSIICFIVAGLLFCYNPATNHLVTNYKPRVTRTMLKRENHKHIKPNYNMSKVSSANLQSVIHARKHSKDVKVIGQILSPSVGVHLPINQGISNDALLLGAGTMRANMPMGQGNYALAGHHMINKSALFTPFWFHAHIGTKIYITNMKEVYTYQVNVRKVISPYDVSVVNNTTKPLLTLITCNDSGSKRLLLRGKLIHKTDIKNTPKQLRIDMNSHVNNHDVLKGY